jgi:hypothetical protein
LVTVTSMAPELWVEAKKVLRPMMSSTEILAVGRAMADKRFEDAFALVGTAGLYRLGILYERAGGKANSDSPVYQALATLEHKGAHPDLSDPWRVTWDPATTFSRKAVNLVLRLQELSFQNAVPASTLKRLSDTVAAEVAMTDVADEQRRWNDVTHFKQLVDSATRRSDLKPTAASGRESTVGGHGARLP